MPKPEISSLLTDNYDRNLMALPTNEIEASIRAEEAKILGELDSTQAKLLKDTPEPTEIDIHNESIDNPGVKVVAEKQLDQEDAPARIVDIQGPDGKISREMIIPDKKTNLVNAETLKDLGGMAGLLRKMDIGGMAGIQEAMELSDGGLGRIAENGDLIFNLTEGEEE